MNNRGKIRRLCLSFVASYLLAARPSDASAASSSVSPIISTTPSATHPSSSSSMAATAGTRRRRKKKRRRRTHRDDDPPPPPSAALPKSVGDHHLCVAEGDGFENEARAISSDGESECEYDKSPPLLIESNGTLTLASTRNPPTTEDVTGESPRPRKKRKKKRRRKVPKEQSTSGGIRNNDEELLLPIGDDDESSEEPKFLGTEEDDVLGEYSAPSAQLHSEESINSKTPKESESDAEKAGLETLLEDKAEPSKSAINVSRNETTETTTIYDDTNADEPATYEYTKHNEEEIVEGVIRSENLDDETVSYTTSAADERRQTPATVAFVHSTHTHENVQLSGGSAGRSVSVRVSRRRKEHRVRITSDGKSSDGSAAGKESSSDKPAKSTVATRGSGKGGECLRRIKREWKDAVRTGVAYDWTNMRTIRDRGSRSDGDDAALPGDDHVRLGPFGKNLLRWHFSVSGPPDSVYESGVYHGRVLLPRDYPGSPPRVQVLTPSGRFRPGADICLSASAYHPETWTPRWTVLGLVDALRLHMLTTANEIGGVEASAERRRERARESRGWRSPGVVDHGRMVAEGLFPLRSRDEEEEDGPTDGRDGEALADAGPPEAFATEVEGGASQRSTDRERGDPPDEKDEPNSPTRRAAKASKQRKKTRDRRLRSLTAVGGGAAVAADAPAAGGSGIVLHILLKRIVVEMLKLPLRMLSVLLRTLAGLESRLRSLLDGLIE